MIVFKDAGTNKAVEPHVTQRKSLSVAKLLQYGEDRTELRMFADASDTMCAVAYLRYQTKEYSADLAFVMGKCRVAAMRNLSIPRLELQATFMALRLKEQLVNKHEMK